jgi:hypothetical protein
VLSYAIRAIPVTQPAGHPRRKRVEAAELAPTTYGAAMSAAGARRTAWWRRWASLPAVVALFFATSVVAATVHPTEAGHAPLAIQIVSAPAQHATGQRPDVRIDARGGPGSVAPELAGLAWLSARVGSRAIAWWHLRQDGAGHHAQARGEAYQGRGPPGRRAADALS